MDSAGVAGTFVSNRDRAVALYDERFYRMWEFYLAACEAAFYYDGLFVFQMQLSLKAGAVPCRRDYIAHTEQKLRHCEKKWPALV